MFTTEHFIWIALCLAFVIFMTRFCLKKQISLKLAAQIMVVICLFSEISKIMSGMMESPNGGMFLNPQSLPFHLCSLILFGIIYITFGKDGLLKQTIIDFVAALGTLGSIAAILIPTNGTDFTSIDSYQCFVYHAGLLWFSLYLIFSGKARMDMAALGRNLTILFFLTLLMIYVNGALSSYDTNFMYVVRPPICVFLAFTGTGIDFALLILCSFSSVPAKKRKKSPRSPRAKELGLFSVSASFGKLQRKAGFDKISRNVKIRK